MIIQLVPFPRNYKIIFYLSELWQEVHARRAPRCKKVDEDGLALSDNIRKVPSGERAQRAGLHREASKRSNILE
jgi:hypothetical protein